MNKFAREQKQRRSNFSRRTRFGFIKGKKKGAGCWERERCTRKRLVRGEPASFSKGARCSRRRVDQKREKDDEGQIKRTIYMLKYAAEEK